jgi:hypothetical protein
MLIGFGLPLLLVPMRWARLFRWEIPQPKELATFLGRSVGVFIIVVAVFAFRAANIPAVQPFFFNMLAWILIGSILIHIYGALRKAQPITETVEILVWFLLLFATMAFYPS